eukprot:jgi/Mesvir1/20568/Mv14812-RA.1
MHPKGGRNCGPEDPRGGELAIERIQKLNPGRAKNVMDVLEKRGFVSDWDGEEALADVLAAQLGEAIAEPDPPVSAAHAASGERRMLLLQMAGILDTMVTEFGYWATPRSEIILELAAAEYLAKLITACQLVDVGSTGWKGTPSAMLPFQEGGAMLASPAVRAAMSMGKLQHKLEQGPGKKGQGGPSNNNK